MDNISIQLILAQISGERSGQTRQVDFVIVGAKATWSFVKAFSFHKNLDFVFLLFFFPIAIVVGNLCN